MPTGQRFAICHIWLWLRYLFVVEFVIFLVEVWVLCGVFTRVVAKECECVSSQWECVCVLSQRWSSSHVANLWLGVVFLVFSYDCSLRCLVFDCQLYFLVRFFSCVVFVFWFTSRLDVFHLKACLTSRMQIFNWFF